MEQIIRYFSLLFDNWLGRISTLGTGIALIAGLLPNSIFAKVSSVFPQEWLIILAFFSFAVANFQIIRKLEKRTNSNIEFDIIEIENVSLSGGAIEFSNDNASIRSEFVVHLQGWIHLFNSGPATSIKIFIASVEPNCLCDEVIASNIDIQLQNQISRHHQPIELDNPHRMQADEMKKVQLRTKIPFSVSCIEETLGCLSAFKRMKVTLGAEQTGHKPIHQVVECNLEEIHQRIDEQITTKLQHLQSTRLSSVQVVEVLKRYWGAN